MRSASVSFVQTERDFTDPMLHACRHGYLRLFTLLSPIAVTLVMFVGLLVATKGSGITLVAGISVFMGVWLLLGNWYLVPRWAAAQVLQIREFNSQSLGRVRVQLRPDGIAWSPTPVDTAMPWGAVRSVDTLPGGISLRFGRPSVILWLPARAFSSRDELEQVGALAHDYFAQAARTAAKDLQWPLTSQQRRQRVFFAALLLWPFILALAIGWAHRK